MFLNNKYTKYYFKIIDNASSFNRSKKNGGEYYESHHIIPNSMGGEKQVLLTAKEHFICHLLLCRMTVGVAKYKMINALIKMSFAKSKGQKRYTAKSYALVKKLIAEKNSEMFKGVPKTEQAKQNMKGRSGTWIRSEEHKKKVSIIQKKRFAFSAGTFTGKKHNENTIKNYKNDLRRRHYGNTATKGRIWVTNNVEDRMVLPNQIPNGFQKGRMKNRKEKTNGLASKK